MEDRRGLLPLPGLGQLAGPGRALMSDLSSGTNQFGSTVQAAAPTQGTRALCVAADGTDGPTGGSGLIPVSTALVIKCERLLVLDEFSQVLKAVSCIRIIPKMPYMQLCCHC